MEYIVGAIALLWIISALGGENSFEAKMGWVIIVIIGLLYFIIK